MAEALSYRDKIAQLALGFIKDDSVVSAIAMGVDRSLTTWAPQILTHSYSRVVMRALLNAHKTKRISVYVTEARPRGLGYVLALSIHDCLTVSQIEDLRTAS